MGIFHTVLYEPLFNLLIWLYDVLPGGDIGFAIIAISILLKLALWPLSRTSLSSQKRLQELQPQLAEIKEKNKDNKEALAKEMMELYKEANVNPLSSCFPLLIQLPILFALYAVLRAGFNPEALVDLYPFVANPGTIDPMFLGSINLENSNIPMAVIAGFFQFIQTKMLMTNRAPKDIRNKKGAKDEDMMAAMNKSMVYFMPIITVVIGASLPGGLVLYWIVVNLFSILQQYLIFNKKKEDKPKSDDTAVVVA